MTIAVHTPICRPGSVDVLVASIKRQHRPDLVWIVADELLAQREDVWREHAPCELHCFDSSLIRERTGLPRTLSAANNRALELARELGADMLVFLNDYVWAPADGIDAFLRMAAEHPRSLLTGACSISEDPDPELVADPDGLYSIFAQPYVTKPRRIGWRDCRLDEHTGIEPCDMEQWEANWAAIPHDLLYDERLRFDETYDRGHYYDNQAYAASAFLQGFDAWIDCENHAISLPHKRYFPEDQAALEELNNRAYHEQRLRELEIERT